MACARAQPPTRAPRNAQMSGDPPSHQHVGHDARLMPDSSHASFRPGGWLASVREVDPEPLAGRRTGSRLPGQGRGQGSPDGPARGTIEALGAPLVEVRCIVPIELARARYRERHRDSRHLDSQRQESELWGRPVLPLGVGPCSRSTRADRWTSPAWQGECAKPWPSPWTPDARRRDGSTASAPGDARSQADECRHRPAPRQPAVG